MKVIGFDTWLARVPYERDRSGTHLLLRLRTDAGLDGTGYVTPLIPWMPVPLRAAVEALATRIVGCDPADVDTITASLLAPTPRPQFDGLIRSAVSVIDIALWDLRAQAAGQPLHRLLGAVRDDVPAYASWNLWWQYDLDTLVRHAVAHVEHGFRAMKLRVGGLQSAADVVERCRRVREAVGDDIELYADANWSWTLEQALQIGPQLAPFRIGWLEDPVPAGDLDGLRRIRLALRTPVCAGETYHEPAQFRRLLAHEAASVVMIDLEVGGVTAWMDIARLAASCGVPVASHLCTEVSAHLVAAAGGLTVEYIPWAEPLFEAVPRLVDGALVLSERPGLGLRIDHRALARLAVR
jgi:L-talarate/galactarate dehydratase